MCMVSYIILTLDYVKISISQSISLLIHFTQNIFIFISLQFCVLDSIHITVLDSQVIWLTVMLTKVTVATGWQ